MTDLSRLSTSDLESLQAGDLSKVSTEGLEQLQAGTSAVPPKRDFLSSVGDTAKTLGMAYLQGRAALADKAVEAIKGAPRFAVENALPLALTAGTAAVSGGLSIPTQLVLMGTAGLVGKYGQAATMGRPTPSTPEAAGAFLSSTIPAGGARGLQAISRFGGQAGEALANRAAKANIEDVLAAVRPAGGDEAVNAAFEAARATKTVIPATHLREILTQVQGAMGSATTPSAVDALRASWNTAKDYFKRLSGKTPYAKGGFTPAELQTELETLGAKIDGLQKAGGSNLKYLYDMKAALMDDLEAAATAGIPGAQKLWDARRLYAKNETVKTVQEYVNNAFRFKRGAGADKQLDANAILNKLEKDAFFNNPKIITPAERDDVLRVLEVANTVPGLLIQDPLGTFGVRQAGYKSGTGIAAVLFGAGGYAHGGPLEASAVAATTVGVASAFEAGVRLHRNVSALMTTDTGRKLVHGLRKDFWPAAAAAMAGQTGYTEATKP